ncbi:hypothetical protein OG705_29125 [Streptomyces sp. NBC_00838]|uniref:hypothetical protein n=1 Tax=Streptomyces sp. NBC_00838 TaxID=2903680 RepID=UPI0038654B0A|nr:hypothetical protein OG705_29125 [Streptomyces sp. NBC_00838]
MTGLTYSAADWREALSRAEDNEFCDTDSLERGGELAGVVSELCNAEGNYDEGLVFAAITVAERLRPEFDRDFLAKVIGTYDEEKTGRLEERAIGFIQERWPDFPVEYTRNLEQFAIEYALKPHERAADDGTNGPACLFDITELLPAKE